MHYPTRGTSWTSRASATVAALASLLTLAQSNPAPLYAQGPGGEDERGSRGPLVLAAQGSFFVGGEIVTSEAISGSGTAAQPGTISINHMYVQYQIPQNGKYRYPVIMVHGGGHTGKTYETTPDGREGWFTSFTRRGFAPYVVDDPNRGRSCCDPTRIHLVRLGLAAPSTLPATDIYSKERAWSTFRFGPAYPDTYRGSKFPFEALDQYAAQWVFTYRDPEELDKITAGIVALLDSIGPAILLTHSQSGNLGLRATFERPELVKAYIGVEPAAFVVPDGHTVDEIKDVPVLTVFGDRLETSELWVNSLASTRAVVEQLNAAGGDGTVLPLAELGITGNTHMLMMDRNNERIATLIVQWIKQHVPGVRGKYQPVHGTAVAAAVDEQ
jgi:pimeloyl-ACP methyl ester carboxylesterase